jgi:hypothetical protein
MLNSAFPVLAIAGAAIGFLAAGFLGATIGIVCGFALSVTVVAAAPR